LNFIVVIVTRSEVHQENGKIQPHMAIHTLPPGAGAGANSNFFSRCRMGIPLAVALLTILFHHHKHNYNNGLSSILSARAFLQ